MENFDKRFVATKTVSKGVKGRVLLIEGNTYSIVKKGVLRDETGAFLKVDSYSDCLVDYSVWNSFKHKLLRIFSA